MNHNLSKSEMNAACMVKLEEIGKTYGRLIFQKAVLFDLPPHDLEAGIDAAVEDSRDFFKENGVDDHDTEIACNTLKLAILKEGRRLVSLIPDNVETVQ